MDCCRKLLYSWLCGLWRNQIVAVKPIEGTVGVTIHHDLLSFPLYPLLVTYFHQHVTIKSSISKVISFLELTLESMNHGFHCLCGSHYKGIN